MPNPDPHHPRQPTADTGASGQGTAGGAISPRLTDDRFLRSVRATHGADGWLLELIAPLRHVRIGRFSVGEAAEVATFCLRHLREDRAGQIAATLSFRTLFGLVPVLVVVTLTARAMLGDTFQVRALEFLNSLGMQHVSMPVPGATADDPGSSVSLAQWFEQLITFAGTVNVAALGWTGFVLVAFSAIWVLITIEEAFNAIFRCEYGRSWIRRMLVYWFVLTVGPLVVGLAPVLMGRITSVVDSLALWDWVGTSLRVGLSLLLFWLALFVAYVTIPATRVAWRPALIGAAVSAILLQIGKGSFGLYLSNAFGVSALYGSLGLIPLFMFWVYLMWLAILFGAELAALMQAIRGRNRETGVIQQLSPEAMLVAMRTIAERFRRGESVPLGELAGIAHLPTLVASAMVDRLEDEGYVRRVGDDNGVMLARPAESIELARILDAAWSSADRGKPADALTVRLRDAQRAAVRGLTLHDA
jgi:YihY family inner membrane protein